MADVFVNGKLASIASKAPYRPDIGYLARDGRNLIAVQVADLRVNRLIGDQ